MSDLKIWAANILLENGLDPSNFDIHSKIDRSLSDSENKNILLKEMQPFLSLGCGHGHAQKYNRLSSNDKLTIRCKNLQNLVYLMKNRVSDVKDIQTHLKISKRAAYDYLNCIKKIKEVEDERV